MTDDAPGFGSSATQPGGNWALRAITRTAQVALALAPDPERPLLEPDHGAGHRTWPVTFPIGGHHTSGYFFQPYRPTGATVCLLHGITAERVGPYYMFVRELLRAGFQVLTFELDGHGRNPRPLGWPHLEENLPAALAYLHSRPDVDPDRIGLLGVSLGGACILRGLPAYPNIAAAVVVSTPHTIELDEWGKWLEALGVFNLELLPTCFDVNVGGLLQFVTTPIRALHDEVGPMVVDLLTPEAQPFIRDLIAAIDPLGHARQGSRVPLLVVNGAWDQLALERHARDFHAAYPGPKDLLVVPRRNHFTIMTTPIAATRAVAWLEHWLARPRRRPAA